MQLGDEVNEAHATDEVEQCDDLEALVQVILNERPIRQLREAKED